MSKLKQLSEAWATIIAAVIGGIAVIAATLMAGNANQTVQNVQATSTILASEVTKSAATQVALVNTIGASVPTPYPTYTLQPTYTPYPTHTPQESCDKYGVKIETPVEGDVTLPVHVSGVFDEIPDDSAIYVANAYRGADVSNYRPETRATVDRQKKKWYSDVESIGKKGDSPYIVALLAGPDGQILIEYHFKVGDETKSWPAITKLPQDTIECDSVRVTIR